MKSSSGVIRQDGARSRSPPREQDKVGATLPLDARAGAVLHESKVRIGPCADIE